MASQVPYTGTLDVSPQFSPMSPAHIDTPIAAFGGTVAQAVEHLGDTETGVGKELFARAIGFQELDQQMKADTAASDLTDKYTQRYLELADLKGQERVDGYKKYMDDLAKDREAGAAGLNSPYAKMKYLSDSRRLQSQMVWHGAVITKQGQSDAENDALLGRMSSRVKNFGAVNSNDPKAWSDLVSGLKQDAADYAHLKGGFEPGTKENENYGAPYVSKHVAEALLAKGLNPGSAPDAMKLAQKAIDSGLMNEEDANRVTARLQATIDGKTSQNIAKSIVNNPANAKKTPSEIHDLIKSKADSQGIDPDNATQNGEVLLARKLNEEQTLARDQWKVFKGTIDGSQNPDGRVPRSLEEAEQDPNFRKFWQDLSADGSTRAEVLKSNVMEQLKRNNTTNGFVENEIGTKEYNNLYAALHDPRATPEDVNSALNFNVMSGHMTKKQQTEIEVLQDNMLKSQSSDSVVKSALGFKEVQAAIQSAGLQKDTPEYNDFIKSFGEAVKNYTAGSNKVMDREKFGQLAQEMVFHTPGSWNPLNWSGSGPMFQNPLEARPQLKASAISAWKATHGGQVPTETELNAMSSIMYQKYFRDLGEKSRTPQGKSTNRIGPKKADDNG